jgi:hypothetical protein
LTHREVEDLQLKNSSVVAVGADRGRREGGHVRRPRSAPSARTLK